MVRCPCCDAPPIEVQRVEDLGLGRCQGCHLVFDLDHRPVGSTPTSSAPKNRRLRAPAALEAWERTVRTKVAYRDEEGMRELTMELPWRGTMSVADAGWFRIYVFILMLTLPLSAVIGGWLTGSSVGTVIGVILALGPALWGVAVNSVNRTRIEVRAGRLSVWHGPMRWLPPLELEARHVDQLFVEERIAEHKGHCGGRHEGLCGRRPTEWRFRGDGARRAERGSEGRVGRRQSACSTSPSEGGSGGWGKERGTRVSRGVGRSWSAI